MQRSPRTLTSDARPARVNSTHPLSSAPPAMPAPALHSADNIVNG